MTTTETQPIYISSGEAARAIGISRRTMTLWLQEGRFPGTKLAPGPNGRAHWRVLLYDVQSYKFKQKHDLAKVREEPEPVTEAGVG